MAGTSLLALIDDIVLILDDVSVMTKVAAKKTAGVLGDDLALNANQVQGVTPARELPVVLAVAKGSAVNKLILVPLALVISTIAPTLVTVLLMVGGAFLCFEGAEKITHSLHHNTDATNADTIPSAPMHPSTTEQDKIKGAIKTDFILSAEIIVISLGTMAPATPLLEKTLVLVLISVVMTVGVYGLVAAIVKLDDLGLYWLQKGKVWAMLGRGILGFAPYLMRTLSILGTIAMFLVGGGIIAHGVKFLHHGIDHIARLGGVFSGVMTAILNGLLGLAVGYVVLALITWIQKRV